MNIESEQRRSFTTTTVVVPRSLVWANFRRSLLESPCSISIRPFDKLVSLSLNPLSSHGSRSRTRMQMQADANASLDAFAMGRPELEKPQPNAKPPVNLKPNVHAPKTRVQGAPSFKFSSPSPDPEALHSKPCYGSGWRPMHAEM